MRGKYIKPSKGDSGGDALGDEASYAVLRCSPDSSDEEVIEQHRKLSAEHSPSKFVELGLPQEYVDLAEKRFSEVQEAFKLIKQKRGF